ncbi:alpha/beta hydrolase [Acidicapsa acidisoli]|uniref:alpha/beta hydrolase n=1 Tax=Acidicapsa acidisoli TaxID=1615681 RepID=UPI0021DF6210|nr:alpha/beta fold hydrolase [Acidicapsa acidisoli]
MIGAIESRELFTLDGQDVRLQGTYHRPRSGAAGARCQNPIGVLFLNSLFLPRTATGDSAVYWAESFAACGYPAFRMDLPGLGDSDAPLNTALLDFINAGGYGSIASAKIKELVERFGLSGIVIVGHCAGAVTALFAAAASKECKGVILLDPYFYLPQQMKKSKAWKRLVRWAATSAVGGSLSKMYDWLKNIRLALGGSRPPGNANFALLQRWSEVANKGLPTLLFKAPGRKSPGTKPRVGEFDYIKHIQAIAARKSQVTVQVIDNTDHSFANRAGRTAVREQVERWLRDCFPFSESIESETIAEASLAEK